MRPLRVLWIRTTPATTSTLTPPRSLSYMDDVLRKLLDGVRRVHNEWSEAQARKQAVAEATNGGNGLTDAATQARQEQFRRTMQMLMRFESSFRRASWKSGCEMVFPILFGHLSFTTHRCWTVFMRKNIYLAAEGWRQHYGQLATHQSMESSTKLDFELPSGEVVTLPGWSTREKVVQTGHTPFTWAPMARSTIPWLTRTRRYNASPRVSKHLSLIHI